MSDPKPTKATVKSDELEYWRLCDELNIAQAAILICGGVPEKTSGHINYPPFLLPQGYEPTVVALTNALRSQRIKGTIEPLRMRDEDDNEIVHYEVISPASHVEVGSLKQWLIAQDSRPAFFFPEKDKGPDYLDRNNRRYSPKLAAAVSAWLAVDEIEGQHPRTTLKNWLDKNAEKFNRPNDESKPKKTTIQEIARIANWKPKGGAPKTPSGKKPS